MISPGSRAPSTLFIILKTQFSCHGPKWTPQLPTLAQRRRKIQTFFVPRKLGTLPFTPTSWIQITLPHTHSCNYAGKLGTIAFILGTTMPHYKLRFVYLKKGKIDLRG
jgi:hypothetical protein